MNAMPEFGVRSVPPCGDCYDDGHCSMNCGPRSDFESLPRQTAKACSEIVCHLTNCLQCGCPLEPGDIDYCAECSAGQLED